MASNLIRNLKISYVCLVILFQILYRISHTQGGIYHRKTKIGRRNVINATEKQIGTVYFLHAAGDTGEDARIQVLDAMPNFSFPHLKIIFPTAAVDMYTCWDGIETNIWFNRLAYGLKIPEDVKSTVRAARSFKKILDIELEMGTPINKTIIGGFSTGGSFALHLAYSHFHDIAGVFAMSSYLPENSTVYRDLAEKGENKPPLLMTHGEADIDVPFYWGHLTFQTLTDLKVKGHFYHEQNSLHEITTAQMEKVYDWILSIIPIPKDVPDTTRKTTTEESLPDEPDSSDYKDSEAVRKRFQTPLLETGATRSEDDC